MSKYLLIISKDYWGTNTSQKIAIEFSNNLSNLLHIPDYNITKLIGNDVNINSVKNCLYSFVNNALMDNPISPILYIYINGHGNQTVDLNGDEIINTSKESLKDSQDELYQLPDGNLLDDEITSIIDNAVLYSNIFERPLVVLISDHCSSGSMIDETQRYFDWISIGSSLDNQDSYINGDGNVMTYCMINVLNANKDVLSDITTTNFFMLLHTEMKNSFIGDIQTPTLHVSSPELKAMKIFKN